MTATVSVVTREANDIITVPAAAFRFRPPVVEENRGWSLQRLFMPRIRGVATATNRPQLTDGTRTALRAEERRPGTGQGQDRARPTARRRRSCRGFERGRSGVVGSEQAAEAGSGHAARAAALLRQGLEDLRRGRGPRQRAGRRQPVDRPRRFRRHHGAVRLRQVDGDEHHRLPRYADRRALLASRHRRRTARP